MPCDKAGHVHAQWPTTGVLTVDRCERYCGFCTGAQANHRWKFAWFLRRHVRTVHVPKEYPNLEVKDGWKRDDDETGGKQKAFPRAKKQQARRQQVKQDLNSEHSAPISVNANTSVNATYGIAQLPLPDFNFFKDTDSPMFGPPATDDHGHLAAFDSSQTISYFDENEQAFGLGELGFPSRAPTPYVPTPPQTIESSELVNNPMPTKRRRAKNLSIDTTIANNPIFDQLADEAEFRATPTGSGLKTTTRSAVSLNFEWNPSNTHSTVEITEPEPFPVLQGLTEWEEEFSWSEGSYSFDDGTSINSIPIPDESSATNASEIDISLPVLLGISENNQGIEALVKNLQATMDMVASGLLTETQALEALKNVTNTFAAGVIVCV